MKAYYIANAEFADNIYGSENPICIDLAEVERLAREWDMTTDELLAQMHEADEDERDEYGISNSRWYAVMMDNEDTDWGTGSYSLREAEEKVAAYKEMGYEDAYIAVIDDGDDPICIEEIR